MSTIIYSKIKGTTYCYRSESYWDKETKSSKSKRVLIGKIDPETGKMVPTQPRGGKRKAAESLRHDAEQYKEKESRIASASQNDVYRNQCIELKQRLLTVEEELASVRDERDDALNKLKRLTEAIRMLPI